MKLDPKQFKRFKELSVKVKGGSATQAEKSEFEKLSAMKNERGSNDIAWWKNYPALLKDVVNLPFNWIPGTPVSITGYQAATSELSLGVIAKAVLRPAIGRSVSDADAFNAQVRQLWLDMHRKYRGIGTYEKSDVGITILAVNGFFETLAKFERIYGVINTYHIGNRAIPYGLKEALGISNDLEENLADFRYSLNLAISKAKQLCLPRGMSVLESDIVALANIFKDSANRRAFLYLFDQDLYALYDPTLMAEGGCVRYVKYGFHMSTVTPGNKSAFTLQDINFILNSQLNALLNDDDISKICSDILAAYGPDNVMTVVDLPEDYKVEPVDDYERKVQFHNLSIVPAPQTIFPAGLTNVQSASDANTITNLAPIVICQKDNVIYNRLGISDGIPNYVSLADGFHPTLNVTTTGYTGVYGKEGEILFDTFVDEPGEAEVMCGTRYTAIVGGITSVATNVIRQEVSVMGTKVCCALIIYQYNSSSIYPEYAMNGSVVSTLKFTTYLKQFLAIMQMDWHPTFFVADANGDLTLFGDVDNFTKIDMTNLGRLHEVALLSGYKIPMISKE